MAFNLIEVLTPEEIKQIHQYSMKVLENIGIQFNAAAAIEIFKKHGFKVENNTVFMQEKQVLEAIKSVPSKFTLHARNHDRTVTIGGGNPVFVPAYGAPFVVDADVGKREATMQDYHNLISLVQSLPNQDVSGFTLVEPGDVPAELAHLYMLYATMIHSDKPYMGSTEGTIGARHTMEMLEIVFGEKISKPVVVGLINPISPLGYSKEMSEALMTYAQNGQPVIIASLIMAGSTGPITLGGVLVQQNAEVLGGIVLTQIINPGTPILYGSTSTNIEMRTGALAIGSPELNLLVTAHAQMARHYSFPSRAGGSLTDSNVPDNQAGFESMFSLLTTVNSGVDYILHSAGILNGYLAVSYEKFVLDDEICGMVRHYRRGIEISEENLAYDVIKNVGHSGNFLMEMHTVERCRSEFWEPELCDRQSLDKWMQSGRKDSIDRAKKRWQTMLSEHEDPPIDKVILKQLRSYFEEHIS